MVDDERAWSYLDLWGWLLFGQRRPGMIGQAVGVSEALDGDWDLKRLGDGQWMTGDGDIVELDEVIPLIEFEALRPKWVHVAPQLEGQLFQEAVSRASDSVRHLNKASTQLHNEISRVGWDLFDMVLVTAELDRVLRASVASIMLAIAAGESQVNAWAAAMGGWLAQEDREPLHRKCQILTRRVGRPLPLGQGVLQDLQASINLRNSLVHPTPVPEAVRLGTTAPGTTISIHARTACLHVREALLATSRALEVADPAYLAYCPPGPPNDAKVWSSAEVMTGVRSDPDFPLTDGHTEPDG